jgi:hypothetical protein
MRPSACTTIDAASVRAVGASVSGPSLRGPMTIDELTVRKLRVEELEVASERRPSALEPYASLGDAGPPSTCTTCPNSGQASFSHSHSPAWSANPLVAGWPQVGQRGCSEEAMAQSTRRSTS